MKVNENISYDALQGLISRATSNERLWIADEWLRGNKTVSIQEYRKLREQWNRMYKQHGTWKVFIRCGTVKREYASGTYADMLDLCTEYGWRINPNNGCWWRMEIAIA